VLAACRTIEQAESAPTLALDAGLSRFLFQRRCKRVVGVTPREYHAAQWREHLQRALDGGFGGDRWGIERKRKLLARERAAK